MKFTGDMLIALGLPQGKLLGQFLKIVNSSCNYSESGVKELAAGFVSGKLPKNINYVNGTSPVSLDMMKLFYDHQDAQKKPNPQNNESPIPYTVFGADNIEAGAIDQMNNAMRLPVTVAGSVMPDSHQGYALPIGGVLATDGVVIPNAVGVDISCRIRFTVFDEVFPVRNSLFKEDLRKALRSQTMFGIGIPDKKNLLNKDAHPDVLVDPRWDSIELLRKFNLRQLAEQQIGSSGSGNHFVDFGEFEYNGVKRLALMSHSGSRGVGMKIAKLYHDLAVSKSYVQKDFQGFAWLYLDSQEGKDYWEAMQLAAEFSRASHELIHTRITKLLGLKALDMWETNHNFAWKENHLINGQEREVIVHRKGAVQAFAGQYGIIGGSMGTPSYVVRGKGNEASLCSCSHGSGRTMSRKAAKESFTKAQMEEFLKNAGVELLDGGLDESPMAYKSVEKVMEAQKDLVDIVGEFKPKIVLMSKDAEE